jgi:hemolysin III
VAQKLSIGALDEGLPQSASDRARLRGIVPAKPRLRGWSHAVAAVAAVIATVGLCARTWEDPPRLFSVLVYGLSSILLFTTSAVYHIGHWRGRRFTLLRALDHANIYILIAGTFVPFCVNMLSGWVRPAILVVIWSLALAGAALSVAAFKLPRWVAASLYVAVGWVGIVPAAMLLHSLPLPAIATGAAGALLYTIGAVIYARRRPNPWPRTFGFHELFHLLVIAGNAAFLLAIWVWVVPFPRP